MHVYRKSYVVSIVQYCTNSTCSAVYFKRCGVCVCVLQFIAAFLGKCVWLPWVLLSVLWQQHWIVRFPPESLLEENWSFHFVRAVGEAGHWEGRGRERERNPFTVRQHPNYLDSKVLMIHRCARWCSVMVCKWIIGRCACTVIEGDLIRKLTGGPPGYSY